MLLHSGCERLILFGNYPYPQCRVVSDNPFGVANLSLTNRQINTSRVFQRCQGISAGILNKNNKKKRRTIAYPPLQLTLKKKPILKLFLPVN